MKNLTEQDKLIIATLANYLLYKDHIKFLLSKFEELGQEDQMTDTQDYWKRFLDGQTEIQKEIVDYFEAITSALDKQMSNEVKKIDKEPSWKNRLIK